MFTIFFDQNYWKRDKVFFTKSFRFSYLYNLVESVYYLLNRSLNNNLIFSGPQKLANILLRIYKDDREVTFNDFRNENSFIIQYDSFGQNVLDSLIKNKQNNSKILVGPLFNLNELDKLEKIMNDNENIYIYFTSDSIKNSILEYKPSLNEKKILSFPIGVIPEKNISLKKEINRDSLKCLIYWKKRNEEELNYILSYLEEEGVKAKIFRYGDYKNSDLLSEADKCDFGIILNKTESQGFAIQELMMKNLPLLVWDYKENNWDGQKLSGSSVPYWSSYCGIKFLNKDEFKKNYRLFIDNINNYDPGKYVSEYLSYEVTKEKLQQFFNSN